MANSEAGTSSDAVLALRGEFQVFLSFRGPDTRHGFTDFLYHGLVNMGVCVFRDDDELRVGEVIGENLLRAIDNSTIYIPIFSRTYASSKWCLRELAHIVDNTSKSEGKKSILPIFLDVEPEDFKLKTSLDSDALREHEEKFPKVVEAWRKALAEVYKIKGWNVKKNPSQAKIVESVVKEVLLKLKTREKLVPENLVGLDDRVECLIEFSAINHCDVRLIGIYGMGGIGKTTIAKVIFNRLSSHFGKCCSFLDDVRENSSTKEGIVELQKKLLSDIVGSEYIGIVKDSEHGMRRIGEILSTKKVLVVLDDVDNKEHIKKLIGNNSLHSGSRIIITTRNTSILEVRGFKGKIIPYEMLKMDDALALQLFCQHAFDRDFPPDDYHGLSSEIVSSMGGLPLAIEVIGSLLNGKCQEIWEETLEKLRKVPEKKILEKLKISYDDLEKHHKQIFLDIACFFFNENKTDAVYMWTACQFYPKEGIEVLTNRCLVKVLDNDKFWMHDQIIALGREIVCEESQDDLGEKSRLWIAEEALQIIGTKKRKDKVQALEMNIWNGSIEITNEEFERIPNLRFLKLCNGTYVGDFAKCHSKLRWISWEPPPGDFEAVNMHLDDIVIFKLGRNFFADDSKAWDLIKGARHLKVLSLTSCDGITTIPDFSKCLGLERLTLASCNKLKRIENFIGDLRLLIELKIVDCTHISIIPRTIIMLHHLQTLNLMGCAIQELPELPTSLTCLRLESTSLRSVHNMSNLTNLVELRLCDYSSYTGKSNLITGCNLGWIGRLSRLESLHLNLSNGSAPLELASLSHLKFLKLCNLDLKSLVQLQASDWKLRNLSILEIISCEAEDIPLDGLPQLEALFIFGCKSIQRLSIPLELRKLREAMVVGCPALVEIQIGGPSRSLESFSVSECESPRRVGGLPYLSNLESLEIAWCNPLANVEGLNELEFLKSLKVWECPSLGRLIYASRTRIPDDCFLDIPECRVLAKEPPSSGMLLKRYKEESLKSRSAKQGKRRRDDDHASLTNTTTKNSNCGQQSGILQHVTRKTRRQAAKIQPPVEVAALPLEAVGPSRKMKKNDSKQVNPIRRSARLMKGPTGGTTDTLHLD